MLVSRMLALTALWGAFFGTPAGFAEEPTPATDNSNVNSNQNVNDNGSIAGVVIAEGQVTDAMGGGQQGVTVTLRRKGTGDVEGELIGTTTTDATGDFQIKAEKPLVGELVIEFTKAKHAPIRHEFTLNEGDGAKFFGEELSGNLTINGFVKDALTDKPIAEASVNLKSAFTDIEEETDESGKFSLTGGLPGRSSLIVEAKGYGRDRQTIELNEDNIEVTVLLKPERILHLKTIDDLGKSIGGATIELYDQAHEDFRTMVSGEDGTVDVAGIHFDAAVVQVRLSHPEHVSSIGYSHNIATPAEQKESKHELNMTRAGKITGRILDAKTDRTIHGARVTTGVDSSDKSPRDWSTYDGQYTVIGISPGPTIVTVYRDGFAPELKVVDVKAGETTQLDIRLAEPRTISGIVKNEKNEPIATAVIMMSKWRDNRTLGLRCVSDDEGKFTLENAPMDAFEINASARGATAQLITVPSSLDKPLEITLANASPQSGGPLASIKIGDTAPIVTLTTLEGKTVSTSEYKGKILLLDFWATWCGPCVGEIPGLIAVHKKFNQRKDFVMVSVSLDFEEKALRDFVKKKDLQWLQTHGETAQAAANAFGVQGIPALFIINAEGKIVAMDLRGEEVDKKLTEVLGKSASP